MLCFLIFNIFFSFEMDLALYTCVIDILMCNENLTVGCILRMQRVSNTIKMFIEEHTFFWKGFHKKMGYKIFHNIPHTISCIKNRNRCRECGVNNGLPTRPSTNPFSSVFICSKCSTQTNTYNELMCRKQFMNKNSWSKQRMKDLQTLNIARITRNNKFLYWGFKVRKKFKISAK